MTRKDYIAIAKIISDAQLVNCFSDVEVSMNRNTRCRIANALANVMAQDNPRFDRIKFLKACSI